MNKSAIALAIAASVGFTAAAQADRHHSLRVGASVG